MVAINAIRETVHAICGRKGRRDPGTACCVDCNGCSIRKVVPWYKSITIAMGCRWMGEFSLVLSETVDYTPLLSTITGHDYTKLSMILSFGAACQRSEAVRLPITYEKLEP